MWLEFGQLTSGAQVSNPGRQVISMSGDGGFAMLCSEQFSAGAATKSSIWHESTSAPITQDFHMRKEQA